MGKSTISMAIFNSYVKKNSMDQDQIGSSSTRKKNGEIDGEIP